MPTRPKISITFLLLGMILMALFTGCAKAGPQPFSILEEGSAAMTTEDFTFALAMEQSEWEELYGQIHAHRLPPPRAPGVDFEKNLILMVAAGWKPSAGYQVHISRIEHLGATLQVHIEVHEPPADSLRLTVMTQPYAVILVERPERLEKVEFLDPQREILHRLHLPSP